MFTNSLLSVIDGTLAPAKIVPNLLPLIAETLTPDVILPKVKNLGRRLLLGAATGSALVAALAMLSEPTLGKEAVVAKVRLPPAAPVIAPQPIPRMDHLNTAASAEEQRDWKMFRARFIMTDGRVVDTFNQGESHTESQGTGMLLAVANHDRATFDLIWNWTARHLSRGSDALHAWRYLPGTANPVADQNNATDGDIYIAGALVRAASLWGSVNYLAAGQAIARDMLVLLVRDVGGRMVLLPGAAGFQTGNGAEINLSYYIFPLLAELQQAAPSPIWARLIHDGHRLVEEARFGRWQLPPDWLNVSARDGSLSLGQRQPPRFSFDAVRVPLFVAWSRGDMGALQRVGQFWGQDPGRAPAWVDLQTGVCAPFKTCGGVVAIAKVAAQSGRGVAQADLPPIRPVDDYYSSALILLSRLAIRETGMRMS